MKGPKTDPSNFRGITVTNCIGKLFNRIIDLRLEKYFEEHSIISSEQIGFTKKKQTNDHLFVLKTLIDKYTAKMFMHVL